MSVSPARRNLNAELRAVEAGHRAYFQAGPPPYFRVVSDTFAGTGKFYRVDVPPVAAGRGITFLCQPRGFAAFQSDHAVCQAAPGVTGCVHAALVARRLEREGLAVLVDGLWVCPGTPEPLACRTCSAPIERGRRCGTCLLESM